MAPVGRREQCDDSGRYGAVDSRGSARRRPQHPRGEGQMGLRTPAPSAGVRVPIPTLRACVYTWPHRRTLGSCRAETGRQGEAKPSPGSPRIWTGLRWLSRLCRGLAGSTRVLPRVHSIQCRASHVGISPRRRDGTACRSRFLGGVLTGEACCPEELLSSRYHAWALGSRGCQYESLLPPARGPRPVKWCVMLSASSSADVYAA